MPIGSTYRGFSFPFRKGTQSFPEAATDDDLIKQSIIQILLTSRGERIMRSTFGSNLMSMVWEPNDPVLEELVKLEVGNAITAFEPRVAIQNITTSREDSTLTVQVDFIVLLTSQLQSVQVSINTSNTGNNGIF